MALSNKQRSRRFLSNIKNNPEKHEEYLRKERERYQKRKEAGKLKAVNDLTERGRNKLRRQWKINQRNSRRKRKNLEEILTMNSPPTSPCEARERGRQRVRRDRAKAYKTIEKMKKTIEETKTRSEKYKKRYIRLKKKLDNNLESPTKTMLKGQRVSSRIRKTLQFHTALIRGIKDSRKRIKNLNQILNHQILRKYKLLGHASKSTGIPYKAISNYKAKRRDPPAIHFIHNAKQRVFEFFVRDDNSRIKGGKKETITRKKVKKQKRLLTDTLKNLHLKFLAESQAKVSYSLFCKLRPFWVLPPTESDRDTCLCKTHENLLYRAEKLHQLKVIKTADLGLLTAQITCNVQSKECMYQECDICASSHLQTNDYNPGQQTTWSAWVNRREERQTFSGDTITVQVTRKIEEHGTIMHLLESFESDLKKASRHFFNISHQFKELRTLRESLQDNEMVIHVDFSENYNCKYDKEIQSVHFGASHNQATLHTGMLYTANQKQAFCSVSDVNKHDPSAIWAHLVPILQDVRSNQPLIDVMHVISDGPTTQYRNKKNFFLFSTRIYDLGFKGGTWNFLEAGHGKGAADGVGAAIKRKADEIIKRGSDIPDGRILYQSLQREKSDIKLFFVSKEQIEREGAFIRDDITSIKGTMMLHQLVTDKQGQLHCRNVSCFCSRPSCCTCFDSFDINFNVDEDNTGPDIISESTGLKLLDDVTEEIKGQWVVVEYDKLPYPGIVQDVRGGEAEVSVMHRIGNNRFFWPSLLEDILWYEKENIIGTIPQPSLVTKRHHQIEKDTWAAVLKYLDDKY